MSSENRTRLAIALISPGSTSISPILPTVPRPPARASGEPLQLDRSLRQNQRGIEPEIHRCRTGVVAAAVDEDVRVDVAGDRVHYADPVAGVLGHPRLLAVSPA